MSRERNGGGRALSSSSPSALYQYDTGGGITESREGERGGIEKGGGGRKEEEGEEGVL